MTLGLFAWGLSGLIVGYTGGTHDVRVIAWILLGMAAVAWIVQKSHDAYVKNARSSVTLAANERRRQGGAV